MKNSLLVLTLILLAITACKKDNDPAAPVDEIVYTQLNPYVELTSVDSFYTISYYGIPIPCNGDSSTIYYMDIDGDSVYDYHLSVRNWYKFVSASKPDGNFHLSMMLWSADSSYNNNMSTEEPFPFPVFVEKNNPIGNTINWFYFSVLMSRDYESRIHTDFSGDKYMGLQLIKGNDKHYGWIHLERVDYFKIRILGYAYNKTPNLPIKAGQKE